MSGTTVWFRVMPLPKPSCIQRSWPVALTWVIAVPSGSRSAHPGWSGDSGRYRISWTQSKPPCRPERFCAASAAWVKAAFSVTSAPGLASGVTA
ncbi:hypothetical protein ACFQ9X_03130 [Catenulispora yoronensis]